MPSVALRALCEGLGSVICYNLFFDTMRLGFVCATTRTRYQYSITQQVLDIFFLLIPNGVPWQPKKSGPHKCCTSITSSL